MKKIIFLALFVMLAGLMFGQTSLPPCNALAVPPVTTNCTDYFGVANYANSPLPAGPVDPVFTILDGGSGYTNPTVAVTDFYGTPTASGATASATFDPTTGAITAITLTTAGSGYVAPVVSIMDPTGADAVVLAKVDVNQATGGMRKFVDAMPDLKGTIAVPDTTIFPNSDFYVIGLMQYTQQMHSSLPPTTLRGYCQLADASSTTCSTGPFYLGPVIVAAKDRAVRVLFKNLLPSVSGTPTGNLFIPADSTYMGAGVGPDGTSPYLENRATLHLHGGATPWISDGTPHQWTVPASDFGTTYNRGLSTRFVPDMWFDTNGSIVPAGTPGATNDPGPGNMTFYWTNQQGGRLMFYHDHAYGITRLNVYVGEAAGYLLADPVEEDALQGATVPGTLGSLVGGTTAPDVTHVIPLVIQDKSFVPGADQLAAQDPTWTMVSGGGTTPGAANVGDLWFPHVYMPNQNPNDTFGGANAFGRWDYGAWFFPPQNSLTAANPPSAVTIPCTSAAFPGALLAPSPANTAGGCPITPNPSGTPEGFMDTPVVNGKAYPVLHVAPEAYRFHILSAGNDRTFNLSWYQACGSGTFSAAATNCSDPGANGAEVPMVPAVRGGPGTTGYVYPDQLDGRDGGVPDSSASGPAWIQIGTEGGLLPNVAVIPPTPVGYEYNRRSITVLNVSSHGLLLGPAERAEVIVDFSAYAGKTLILYNDAPAPVPAFDSRIDYYTGDMDQVSTGGAPTTLPGFGPNTRTMMQVVVDPGTPGTSFNLATLKSALPAVFKATQPVPTVPEPTYPPASGGNSATATYARIQDNSITFTPVVPLVDPEPCSPPSTNCVNFDQKAIQELFTLDYGRMNATMGTELPFTNFITQTTIPYGYVDWPTEIIHDGQTQIWKLTHNGVDTHFIHFHLFNVQVINRIGWDGAVKPPDANELGWKDTVRMNPLEDIVFALTPVKQNLPFPLPDSIRPMDVTMPTGVADPAISGLDPASGNATITNFNSMVNFGHEYVWHCHILGHEENDMMRPMIFQAAPPAPSAFTAVRDMTGKVILTWTDNSASESGFDLQRDTDPAFSAPVNLITNGNASIPASAFGGPITVTDSSAPAGPVYYQVRAYDDFTPQSPLVAPFQVVPMFSAWVPSGQVVAMTTMNLNAPTITYGQNGAVTVSVTSAAGIVTGNVALTVDGVALPSQVLAGGSTTFTVTLPAVGSHPLVATFAAQNGFAASSASGTLIVTAAGVTITASSASVAYGSAVPAITFTSSGFIGTDTLLTSPTCLTTYTTTPPNNAVGTYPTSCTGATASANYSISYVNGTVSVTPVPLTITASSTTIAAGSPVPVITPSYSGFVAGDTPASLNTPPTCSTLYTQGSPAGAYTSSCSGAVDPNYAIAYVPGVVTVTGAGPVLSVVPTALAFSSAVNVTTPSQPVVVKNVGGAALRITSINLGGANPGRFTITHNCPIGGTGLASAAFCTVNVTFTPNNNTARSATLRVNVAAPAISQTVTLTGTTVRPTVTVAPPSIAFVGVRINTTSVPQPVTVTNTSTVPLVISNIAIAGGNVARFARTNVDCPIGAPGLAAGASCTVNVTFSPNNLAPRASNLRITDNAASSPQNVPLSGTGTP